MKKDTYNHVLKYTGLLGGVQVFYILMSIVRNKFTAMFIGAWGIGLVETYNRAVDLIANMTNFGIGFSAVRRLSELHEQGKEEAIKMYIRLIRSWALVTALLGTLICLLSAPLLSYFTLSDFHTTKGFVLVAPMVGILAITGGEVAILKGLQRLKQMAAISALGALVTMLLTIPAYWLLGLHGVIPVLLSTTAAVCLLNLYATTRDYPYRVGLRSMKLMKSGGHLLKLGGAYILAGTIGSGAELIVRSYVTNSTSLNRAGLYAVGVTLIVSYARLAFVAMDADFFPRLSAAGDDRKRRNNAINRQIDVLVLLMAPFLIAFALFLPIIVRVLYTPEFLPVVSMVLCGLSFMYFKAVYTPIAYLPLARGHSRLYLLMEFLYNVVFTVLVIVGYHVRGIVGAGIALSLANLFDLINISLVYARVYDFRFERRTLLRCIVQYALLVAGIGAATVASWGVKLLLGLPVLGLSLWFAWNLLRKKTNIVDKIKSIVRRKKP